MSDEARRAIGGAVRGADRGLRVIDGGKEPPAEEPKDGGADRCPVTALGHLAGVFHLLDVRGQKRELSARALGSRHELLALFGGDDAWLRRNHPKKVAEPGKDAEGNKTTVWITVDFSVNKAAAALQAACFAAGLFGDQVVLRRPGVWLGPNQLPAVHCGDQVLIGDEWHDAGIRTWSSCWTAAAPTARPKQACPIAVAIDLQQRLTDYWRWSAPGAPIAVLGALCNAYYGAAVAWRPAMFVTGDTGSGKTALQRVIRAALPLHHFDNDTTKAGLEQAIDGRAMASIIDEAADRADRAGARSLVDLVLSASGDEGTKGSRGTVDGKGRRIEVSGSIIMFSINPPDLEPQHLGRFTLVELVRPAAGVDFRAQHQAAAEFARENGAALWGRALGAFERYHAALSLFRVGLAAAGCAPREMDQAGALIAGWWVLTHEGLPDDRGVAEGVGALDGFVRRSVDVQAENRPRRCVQHLLSKLVPLHRSTDRETVGALLRQAWGEDGPIDAFFASRVDAAMDLLQRFGIRPVRKDRQLDRQGRPVPRKAKGDGAWFATANPELAAQFNGTPFDSGRWRYELLRLDTALRSDGNVRIGAYAGRAIWLSRPDLDPQEDAQVMAPGQDLPEGDGFQNSE